jgi:hypothetical protein
LLGTKGYVVVVVAAVVVVDIIVHLQMLRQKEAVTWKTKKTMKETCFMVVGWLLLVAASLGTAAVAQVSRPLRKRGAREEGCPLLLLPSLRHRIMMGTTHCSEGGQRWHVEKPMFRLRVADSLAELTI